MVMGVKMNRQNDYSSKNRIILFKKQLPPQLLRPLTHQLNAFCPTASTYFQQSFLCGLLDVFAH